MKTKTSTSRNLMVGDAIASPTIKYIILPLFLVLALILSSSVYADTMILNESFDTWNSDALTCPAGQSNASGCCIITNGEIVSHPSSCSGWDATPSWKLNPTWVTSNLAVGTKNLLMIVTARSTYDLAGNFYCTMGQRYQPSNPWALGMYTLYNGLGYNLAGSSSSPTSFFMGQAEYADIRYRLNSAYWSVTVNSTMLINDSVNSRPSYMNFTLHCSPSAWMNITSMLICDDTDNDGNCTQSATPLSNVTISSPVANGVYNDNLMINYTTASNGVGTVSYNISLLNSSGSVLKSIKNTTYTEYFWNTRGDADGVYSLQINVTDTSGQFAKSNSATFTINNSAVNITKNLVLYCNATTGAIPCVVDNTTLLAQSSTSFIKGGGDDITGIIGNGYSNNIPNGLSAFALTSQSQSRMSHIIPFTMSVWLKITDNRNTIYVYTSTNGVYPLSMTVLSNILNVNFNWQTSSQISMTYDLSKLGISSVGFVNSSSTWHHFVIETNETNQYLYIDGVLRNNTNNAITMLYNGVDAVSINQGAYFGTNYNTAIYNVSVDELGYWNRIINSTEVSRLYDGGYGLTYPFTTSISRISQTPTNITSDVIFRNGGVRVNYSILGYSDNSTIKLYETFNSSRPCQSKYLGICNRISNTFYQLSPASNSSYVNYSFFSVENDVMPYVSMLNETKLETGIDYIQRINLTTTSSYVQMMMLNLSNITPYNLVEINVNNSGSTAGTLNVYFCNNTISGTPLSNTGSCTLFYNVPNNITFNHTHQGIGSDIVIPMTITNGKVNNLITIGYTSYIILTRTNSVGSWTVGYGANQSYLNSLQTSNNAGNTWNNQSGIGYLHFHQFNINDAFCYKASADGLNDTLYCDQFELVDTPPSQVEFSSPNGTFAGNDTHYNGAYIWINYTNASDDNGILYYNISLCNVDGSYNSSIIANNSLNNSYYWNMISIADGNYTICVNTYDTIRQVTKSNSPIFIIDKISPYIFWVNPSSTIITQLVLGATLNMDVSFYDDNLYAYEMVIYNPLGAVLFQNNQTDIGFPSYNFITNVVPTVSGVHTIYLNVSDSHTKNKIKDMPNVATPNGMEFYNDDYKGNKELKRSKTKIDYSSSIVLDSIQTIKKEDRYNFKLTLKNKPSTNEYNYMTFTVNCSGLNYVDNSKYTAHFVCNKDKLWVDFMSPNVVSYTISDCLNVSNDCKNVNLYMKLNDTITFESIGGLNFNTSIIQFNVTPVIVPNGSSSSGGGTTYANDTGFGFGTCPSSQQGVYGLYFIIGLFLVIGIWTYLRKIGVFVLWSGIIIFIMGVIYASCNNYIGIAIWAIGLTLILLSWTVSFMGKK